MVVEKVPSGGGVRSAPRQSGAVNHSAPPHLTRERTKIDRDGAKRKPIASALFTLAFASGDLTQQQLKFDFGRSAMFSSCLSVLHRDDQRRVFVAELCDDFQSTFQKCSVSGLSLL